MVTVKENKIGKSEMNQREIEDVAEQFNCKFSTQAEINHVEVDDGDGLISMMVFGYYLRREHIEYLENKLDLKLCWFEPKESSLSFLTFMSDLKGKAPTTPKRLKPYKPNSLDRLDPIA